MRIVTDDPRLEPRRASPGAAGLDLSAAEETVLSVGGRRLVPTGVRLQLPDGSVGLITPRSGWALRYGISVLNAPGTIDADYRGEIGVILHNHGQKPIAINKYDRIAQLVIVPIATPDIEPVGSLDNTERGAGGYGHTGGMQ